MIDIPRNKHIGIIFTPRSGSHVVRHFLASALRFVNAAELFNLRVYREKFIIDEDTKIVTKVDNPLAGSSVIINDEDVPAWANENFKLLDDLSEINRYCVFGIFISDSFRGHEDILKTLASRDDVHFIELTRLDVLYSIISTAVSSVTGIWHSLQNNNVDSHNSKNVEKFSIDIPDVEMILNQYIYSVDVLNRIFNITDKLYYEQFQFNAYSNLLKIFPNVPKKLSGIPYNKFSGNYKDLIENLDEIEEFYENFVNQHPEYFPQYFGKLDNTLIPECQGRQPRNLLNLK